MLCGNGNLLVEYAVKGSAEGVANMAIGELVNSPPEPLWRELLDAPKRGNCFRYVPVLGNSKLREVVSGEFRKRGVASTPETTLVGAGSRPLIAAAIRAILWRSVRREIVVFKPAWPSYDLMIMEAGGRINQVFVSNNGFVIPGDKLSRFLTPHTRGVIINSPNNPTGTVSNLDGFAGSETSNDTWFIFDDAYDGLVYDSDLAKAKSFAGVSELTNRSIVITSCSKNLCAAGLRVGFLTAPESIFPVIARIYSTCYGSGNASAQYAVLEALRNPDEGWKKALLTDLKRKRDMLTAWFDDHDIVYPYPDGAVYVFADFSKFGRSVEVADMLLEKAKAGTVPGTAFGNDDGYLRFSYASLTAEQLEEALGRMENVLF